MTVEYQSLLQELDRRRQSFDTTMTDFPAATLCAVYVYRLGEVPLVIERSSLLGSQAVAALMAIFGVLALVSVIYRF